MLRLRFQFVDHLRLPGARGDHGLEPARRIHGKRPQAVVGVGDELGGSGVVRPVVRGGVHHYDARAPRRLQQAHGGGDHRRIARLGRRVVLPDMPVQHVEKEQRRAGRVQPLGRAHSSLTFFEKS